MIGVPVLGGIRCGTRAAGAVGAGATVLYARIAVSWGTGRLLAAVA